MIEEEKRQLEEQEVKEKIKTKWTETLNGYEERVTKAINALKSVIPAKAGISANVTSLEKAANDAITSARTEVDEDKISEINESDINDKVKAVEEEAEKEKSRIEEEAEEEKARKLEEEKRQLEEQEAKEKIKTEWISKLDAFEKRITAAISVIPAEAGISAEVTSLEKTAKQAITSARTDADEGKVPTNKDALEPAVKAVEDKAKAEKARIEEEKARQLEEQRKKEEEEKARQLEEEKKRSTY